MWETSIEKSMVWDEFLSYYHFIVYDFETILAPINEHPTDDLTYLSRHACNLCYLRYIERRIYYLIDENPKSLIEQFIKTLRKKQEPIVGEVLKQHPDPSDFQMLPGFCRFRLVSPRSYIVNLIPTLNKFHNRHKKWVNQVPVISFNSGKSDLNLLTNYFVKYISFSKRRDCNKEYLPQRSRTTICFWAPLSLNL